MTPYHPFFQHPEDGKTSNKSARYFSKLVVVEVELMLKSSTMSSWFHAARGRYHIGDKWIGLDYSKLFLDPLEAEVTLRHEMTHGLISEETDFGQATQAVFQLEDGFTHLQYDAKYEIGKLLYREQLFVQEGIATLMQVSYYRHLTNKPNALAWSKEKLHPEYYERLQKLIFALDLSKSYWEHFTKKIPWLAMEFQFRKDAAEQDLFSNTEKLEKYLSNPDKNPNARLEKIVATLKYKNWLVTKPIPEIAEACGVAYFDTPSKEEVAKYLTYVTSFTKNPHTFSAADITELPPVDELLAKVSENIIVANMNFDFVNTAQPLFNLDDFIFHSDRMELVFVNLDDEGEREYKDYIQSLTGEKPEITMGGFYKTGEKYLTATSKKKAEELLNNQLKEATLLVKWGGYSLETDSFIWSKDARPPELVVYNKMSQLASVVDTYLDANPSINMQHLHIGASEKHPLQTLVLKFDNSEAIHVVNTFGNRGIGDFIRKHQGRTKIISNDDFAKYKRHINNLMACWMGMRWDVDWVETMLDGKELHFRS